MGASAARRFRIYFEDRRAGRTTGAPFLGTESVSGVIVIWPRGDGASLRGQTRDADADCGSQDREISHDYSALCRVCEPSAVALEMKRGRSTRVGVGGDRGRMLRGAQFAANPYIRERFAARRRALRS